MRPAVNTHLQKRVHLCVDIHDWIKGSASLWQVKWWICRSCHSSMSSNSVSTLTCEVKGRLTEWLTKPHTFNPCCDRQKKPGAAPFCNAHLKTCLWSGRDERLPRLCWTEYTSDTLLPRSTLLCPSGPCHEPPPPNEHAFTQICTYMHTLNQPHTC